MPSQLPGLGRKKTPEVYQHAVRLSEGFLIAIARSRSVVTYLELGDVIALGTGHAIFGPPLGELLGELVRDTYDRYGVVLSSVVVSSDDFAPGRGFQALADELGLRRPGEDDRALADRLRTATWQRFGS